MKDEKKSYLFHHAKLGHLKGRLSCVPTEYFTRNVQSPRPDASLDVVQFRSVPYAEIEERFKPCCRLDKIPDEFDDRPRRDFTDYGFECPQPPYTLDRDAFIGGPLAESEHLNRFDEFKCLTLTICVPRAILQRPQSQCPVMVYIHGGGFLEGGASFPLFDGRRLTALSHYDGNPIILINVSYRLGLFGYLSCSDVFDEQRQTAGKEKPVGVVGHDDQRQAFLWIRDHIAGFGGDPSNVTAFGESAGGGAISFHCCSEYPLFKRAVMQSSCGASKPPAELSWYDKQYYSLLKRLGITVHPQGGSQENDDQTLCRKRLEALRKVPVHELVRSVNRLNPWFFMPFRDHWHSDFDVNYDTEARLLHSNPWLESLMMGDTLFEGTFVANVFDNTSFEMIQQGYYRAFGKELSDKILDAYGVRSGMSQRLLSTNMMTLYGDFGICQSNHHVIESLLALQTASSSANSDKSSGGFAKKLYRYNLALPLPFSSFNMSHIPGAHLSDVAFLFLNLLGRFPTFQHEFYTEQTVGMARRWIAYAHGNDPWPQYRDGGGERKIAILDQVNGWIVRSREEDENCSDSGHGTDLWGGRRYKQWAIIEEVMDQMRTKGSDEPSIARRRQLLHGRQTVQDLTTYMAKAIRSKV